MSTTKLTRKEEDLLRLIQSDCHLGPVHVNKQMERFVSHRTKTGQAIVNVEETYNKIKLAARLVAAVNNLEDVLVISNYDYGQRAVIKFASYTKCSASQTSRWIPGTLTNQNSPSYKEPRLLIVADTEVDGKAVLEASYVNIPVIALCHLNSNLKHVDVAIPCHNKSTTSVSMIFWLLAREILILRGEHDRNEPWNVCVDLFYHKTKEELEQQEAAAEGDAADENKSEAAAEGDDDEDGEDANWEHND